MGGRGVGRVLRPPVRPPVLSLLLDFEVENCPLLEHPPSASEEL